jgi:hypothetical protein
MSDESAHFSPIISLAWRYTGTSNTKNGHLSHEGIVQTVQIVLIHLYQTLPCKIIDIRYLKQDLSSRYQYVLVVRILASDDIFGPVREIVADYSGVI